MAEDKDTDVTDDDKITLSVSEYNQMKASLEKIKGIDELKATYESQINELNEKLKSKKQPEGIKREDVEKEIRSELSKEIEETQKERDQLKSHLKRVSVTDKVLGALGDSVMGGAKKWIAQEIEKECDIEGDFDNGQIIVKDENGNIRWSATKPDQKLGVDEYAGILKQRYPEFFNSTTRSAEPQQGNRVSGNTTSNNKGAVSFQDLERMSETERKTLAKENPRAYDLALSQADFK